LTSIVKFTVFPYHFHYETEENVLVSEFKKDIKEGFRDFLGFIMNKFFGPNGSIILKIG